jgi:hypothetical protein
MLAASMLVISRLQSIFWLSIERSGISEGICRDFAETSNLDQKKAA